MKRGHPRRSPEVPPGVEGCKATSWGEGGELEQEMLRAQRILSSQITLGKVIFLKKKDV